MRLKVTSNRYKKAQDIMNSQMLNSQMQKLTSNEIARRIREIQGHWDSAERLKRKIAGEARRETLESILQSFKLVAT
jgi:hypothetical protein